MPDIVADLHMHSNASDGDLEPEEVVDRCAEVGLETIALTDHDTVGGVERAMAQGKKRGVEVISGCELTAYEGSIELHILAYFFDLSADTPLHTLLEKVRARRRERAFEMGRKLRDAGYSVDDEDIMRCAGKADSIGLPHVAEALVRRGVCRDINTAMNEYLRAGQVAYTKKLPLTPEEIFAAVRDSGGITVLAHPGIGGHDELISPLFGRGMDGVEAYHSRHGDVNRRFFARLAERYEKGVGGGSDFHGPTVKPGLNVGDSGIGRRHLEDLRQRAARRRRPDLAK